MKIRIALLAFCALVLALASSACGGGQGASDRGRYIYDYADFLPMESEMTLASFLWRLDSKTDYEVVLVFSEEQLGEPEMITWFNEHGVGKKNRDNGAAIFVLPDHSIFVSLGSGQDKISVAQSKTMGERTFVDFNDDPVLTLLRFVSAVAGEVDQSFGLEEEDSLFDNMVDSLDMVLLWFAFVALAAILFLQFDGFQGHDLILPLIIAMVLGIFFGISAASSSSASSSYTTYGVITSTDKNSYTWVHMHQNCTSSNDGKTTTTDCDYYSHIHTTYTNRVQFLSYESRVYDYKFVTDEYAGAWHHDMGELDALILRIKDATLRGIDGISDNSGGETVGDGVWLMAAQQ